MARAKKLYEVHYGGRAEEYDLLGENSSQWFIGYIRLEKQQPPCLGPPMKHYTTDRAEMLKLQEEALTRAVERNKEWAIKLQEQLAEVKKLRSK